MEIIGALAPVVAIPFAVFGLVMLFRKMRRSPSTTGVTDATVEMVSTAAHQATLTRGVRFAIRLFAGFAVGCLAIFVGFGLALVLTSTAPDLAIGLGVPGGIGGLIALLIGGLGWWQVRALRTDLRDGTFLRTTGPVRVTTIRHGSFLDLADRSFSVTYDVGRAATHAEVYQVDHSPRGHFVFELRDRAGEVVYRDKQYRPGP
jgi:hypothetical protein